MVEVRCGGARFGVAGYVGVRNCLRAGY